jgi:hypothetical protein
MAGTFNLNTGTYWGNGVTKAVAGYNGGYGNRNASGVQLNRISRDIATGYSSDLSIVSAYLQKGETDKAIDLYQDIVMDAKTTALNYGYSLTDSQIESILNNAYGNLTGVSMNQDVSDNTSGSFMTGIKQGIPILGLFVNGTSSDEALAEMSGGKTSVKDKVVEYGGAMATGAAIGTAIGGFPIGTAVGAGVGAVQTFLKDLF